MSKTNATNDWIEYLLNRLDWDKTECQMKKLEQDLSVCLFYNVLNCTRGDISQLKQYFYWLYCFVGLLHQLDDNYGKKL